MRYLTLLLMVLLTSANPAYSKSLDELSPDQIQRVFNNAGMDATYCALFFKISVECLENTPSEDSKVAAAGFRKARDSLYELMTVLNSGGGMNEAGFKARFLDVHDDLQKQIGGHCSNIAAIRRPYLDQCIEMHNNPEARVTYWQNKLYPEH